MPAPVLHIGNKNYSSWSMRPWLALKWGGVAFEENVIALGGQGYGQSQIAEVRAVSPSGRVPALRVGDVVIHESLAICEWAAEQAPDLWPKDTLARAEARAAACEMHAGFFALRRDLSMNVRRRLEAEPDWPADTRADLQQLFETWARLLEKSGGPFLFGARSIADAMFAPIASRLRTYAVAAPDRVRAYCNAIFADAAFQEWERAAHAETWIIEETEALYR
ncbi:MAG TPA: glutathione S-transferase [Terricaulis sp.]|nr:glutathione S-transferase [Terricaulis sp.]HRP09654.1 glutathione S-transferase [Terricaulis sp.]